MRKITMSACVLAAGILATSCGSEPQNTPSVDKTETTETAISEDTVVVEYVLPSTLQIGEAFQKAGLPYIDGVTNDPSKVESYNTRAKRLLNYGVYMTDLTYCALNNQSQSAITYINATSSLSEQLGFGEVYGSGDLMTRFEKSIGNREALLDVMTEIQMLSDEYVDDNNMQREALAIFAGAWVEGMYIGVQAAGGDDKDAVAGRLSEQMGFLSELLEGLRNIPDPEIMTLSAQLTELLNTYDSIDAVKASGDNRPELSYMELKDVASQIISIRQSIIS